MFLNFVFLANQIEEWETTAKCAWASDIDQALEH